MHAAARHRLLAEANRRTFEQCGFAVVPNALPDRLLGRLVRAHDRVYAEERAAGRLADDGSLHLLGFLGRDPAFLELLDLPAVFPLVWGALGWNIYAYHSHLDAHPPVPDGRPRRWGAGTRTAGARISSSRRNRRVPGSR